MAKPTKLINKLKRRQRSVAEATEAVVKLNKLEETLQDSPGVQKLMRGTQRRMDESWGYDTVGHEPHLEYQAVASLVERYDFDLGAPTDYGIRLTLAAAVISGANGGSGIRVGDLVQLQEGALDGRMLQVVSIPDSTHLRLDDVASYVGPESNISIRMIVSGVKKSYV